MSPAIKYFQTTSLNADKYKKGRVRHVLFPFTLQVEFLNHFQVFI